MKKFFAISAVLLLGIAPAVYAGNGAGSNNGIGGSGGAGNSGTGNSGQGVGNGGGGNQGSNGTAAGNTSGGGNGGHGGGHGHHGGSGGEGGHGGHHGGGSGGGSSTAGPSIGGPSVGEGATGLMTGQGQQDLYSYLEGTRFLTADQAFTWDAFKYCERQQPGLVSLGQLRVDGSFTYYMYIDLAQSNLQNCMKRFGFVFETGSASNRTDGQPKFAGPEAL